MLFRDDAALAAHLTGAEDERRPTLRLAVDWDGTGVYTGRGADLTAVVRSLAVEQTLTGDLPEEAGLIDGYTSATCEVELEGWLDDVDLPVTAALSPYVPGSIRDGRQLVRADLRADLGMVLDSGPRLARMFSGPLRQLENGESAGRVKLTAVDPSDRLRAPITLPIYGEFLTHVTERGRGDPAKGWSFTVNTQWLIAHILGRNNVWASPPPRPESIIVASGHGGLVASVGFNGAPISRASNAGAPVKKWTEDGNPWGMLATPEGTENSYQEFYGFTDGVNVPVRFAAGQGVGYSGWFHIGSSLGGAAATEKVLWQLWPTTTKEPRLFLHGFGDGSIAAGLFDENAYKVMTPKVALTSAPWHFVGVHYRWTDASTLAVTIRTRAWDAANNRPAANGNTYNYTLTGAKVTVVSTPFYEGYRAILQCRAYMWRAWMLLQVWPGATPPAAGAWQGEAHTPQASIARGLNELVYLPDVVNADSWELLKSAVAAELGVHRHDEVGFYSFRPRTDTRRVAIDVELDVRTNILDVSYTTSTDSVRNVVGIQTSAKYHTGKLETVVKAEDAYQFTVPAGKRYIYNVDWPFGAAGYQGGVLPYHRQEKTEVNGGGFPLWSGDIVHGWTYSTRGASGFWTIADNTQSVVVRYVQVNARAALIIVDNTAGTKDIRLSTIEDTNGSGGEPALRIGGWPLVDVPDHVEQLRAPAARITAHRGERALAIEANEWRQDPTALRPLMSQLLDALAEEIEVLEDLEIVGDPRVQVGDVARCRFPYGATPVVGTVVKTNHGADDSGVTSTVSVRPLPEFLVPTTPTTPTTPGGDGTTPGSALAPPGWRFYIDISRYQEGMNLAAARDQGYAGLVAKVGQGAGSGTDDSGKAVSYGQSIDPLWATFRDTGRPLWPSTFAGYWYVGNTETPASQATRCKAALGDTTIPVMLDWELTGGNWSNLLAVLSAFRSAGLRVSMLYTNLQGYAPSNGASSIDSATGGLALVNSRYWITKASNPAQDPRTVFDDILANRPDFGRGTILGGTVDALQFTDAGVVYPGGPAIDVNAFLGDDAALAAMFAGS